MTFAAGRAVIVAPPMTPMARHPGMILRKARYGWHVRFDAWGMLITETVPEGCLTPIPI